MGNGYAIRINSYIFRFTCHLPLATPSAAICFSIWLMHNAQHKTVKTSLTDTTAIGRELQRADRPTRKVGGAARLAWDVRASLLLHSFHLYGIFMYELTTTFFFLSAPFFLNPSVDIINICTAHRKMTGIFSIEPQENHFVICSQCDAVELGRRQWDDS